MFRGTRALASVHNTALRDLCPDCCLALHRRSKAALLRSKQPGLQSFLCQQPQTVKERITMRGPLWQPLRLPRKGQCWVDVSAAQCAPGVSMLMRSAAPTSSEMPAFLTYTIYNTLT